MQNIKESLDLQRLAKQRKVFKEVLPKKFASDWKPTGFLIQDMIQSCVTFYRRKKKPLKTIYLKPQYYERYKLWVSKLVKDGKKFDVENNALMFDGVNIDKGSFLQLESIYVDFYEQQIPIGPGLKKV